MDLLAIKRAEEEVGLTQAILRTEELTFDPEIRAICETNVCRNYGSCWACPPAVGTLEECRERMKSYRFLSLFSKKYPLSDSFDYEGMREALFDFKRVVDRLDCALKPLLSEYLLLSNEGCGRCKSCTYPHAPCRFPDQLRHSIEGYGLHIAELARKAGLSYCGGPDTVTFFGGLLFDRSQRKGSKEEDFVSGTGV